MSMMPSSCHRVIDRDNTIRSATKLTERTITAKRGAIGRQAVADPPAIAGLGVGGRIQNERAANFQRHLFSSSVSNRYGTSTGFTRAKKLQIEVMCEL
jgi:hypothetical protein